MEVGVGMCLGQRIRISRGYGAVGVLLRAFLSPEASP